MTLIIHPTLPEPLRAETSGTTTEFVLSAVGAEELAIAGSPVRLPAVYSQSYNHYGIND